MYGPQRRHAFCIRHFELIECQPSHTEKVVSFDDLRLDSVAANLGMANCGSSTSLVEPMSITTSGHGSNGDQSNTPTTISLTSSSSMKSNQATSGTSSAFSSHGTGRMGGNSTRLSHFEYRHEYDEDDDDDEQYGEVDSVNEMTTLEIVLPHELLEKNLQIRVAPDVDSFDIIYKSTFSKTNPIIMYCFERYDDKLTETDVAHLDALRQLMPSSPILFAHIVDFDPTYHTCLAPTNVHQQQFAHMQSHPYFNHPTCHHHSLSPNTAVHLSPSPKKHHQTAPHQQANPTMSPVCGSCIRSDLTESEQQWHAQCHTQMPMANGIVRPEQQNCANCQVIQDPHVTESTSKCCDKKSPTKQQHPESSSSYPQADSSCADSSNLRASESLWRQLCELGFFQETASSTALQAPLDRQQKRLSSGYYIINDRPFKCAKQNADYGIDVRSRFLCHSKEFCYFVDFFRSILKSNLIVAATLLNEIHNQFIQYFIFSAFDMTWNLNFSIPKRLEYAKSKEADLSMSLKGIATRKHEEISQLFRELVNYMRDAILVQS